MTKRDRAASRGPWLVERDRAERYLLFMLVGFAATVILTRWFLQLTGFPKVGGGDLHVAHALWGGLLLFVASLLPLIFANPSVYPVAGGLSGVGVGLFVDEVGKFITQRNDYFYPAAAPLIYAVFLLAVLLYLHVRRPDRTDARSQLYAILDGLAEIADQDLESEERAAILGRIHAVAANPSRPDLAKLARALESFVESGAVSVTVERPRFWHRWMAQVHSWEPRWLGRRRLKALLVAALLVSGVHSLLTLGVAVGIETGVLDLSRPTYPTTGVAWTFAHLAVEGVSGLILIVGAALLLRGSDRGGISVAYFGLLITVTLGDLLSFYLAQLDSIIEALLHLVFLLGVVRYRQRFLAARPPPPVP